MQTCLFYGNCQTNALCEIFSHIANYKFIRIPPVHKLKTEDIQYIYTILPTLDILIIQNISDNYKNNYKLSTKSIVSYTNKNCKIIYIPVCYFDFYYPNLIFLDSNDTSLQEHYHDKYLLKLYFNNDDDIINKYLKYINDKTVYSTNYLLHKAYSSICEMKKRENEKRHDIKISNFIENNFRKYLLFYTNNHPTKYLLNYICEQLCEILNIPYREQNIDPMDNKIIPIQMSLQNVVDFNIRNYVPILNNTCDYRNIANYLVDLYDNEKFSFIKYFH
ncbi:hypothetical protein BMW23_0276 [Bodo saltans virus]|uniref:Polysaccharide biosynthesis enzyme WcbI domain-containing protein n=1 Tax=Bodo saltans virus TaxID=2024608 RepID=A0A2H4UTY7_9VIRU|nr:hypothetical protein QJ851_gp0271 [Bodo saltans virus]ATZ80334.1 hypothetical protein BMW23_0276 [Bodo saltans virus]